VIIMEIEIDSKRNNPLLNRTEVYFTVKHSGEKTPNRELIRSELADKLNAKKENIVVNVIDPSFGLNETTGYAKIYSSTKDSKDIEAEHILKRNKLVGEKKGAKKGEAEVKAPAEQEKPPAEEKPTEEKTSDVEQETKEPTAEKKEEKSDDKSDVDNKQDSSEDKKE